MNESQQALLSTLADEIVALAKQSNYLPPGEGVPYVAELEGYGAGLVNGVCAAISEDAQKGLEPDAVAKVFEYVFLKSFEAVHRWHRSEDGVVAPPGVTAADLRGETAWDLPGPLLKNLGEVPTPAILFDVTARWIAGHREELEKEALDLWPPLVVGLQMTFTVAVSMALQVFGYQQQ